MNEAEKIWPINVLSALCYNFNPPCVICLPFALRDTLFAVTYGFNLYFLCFNTAGIKPRVALSK